LPRKRSKFFIAKGKIFRPLDARFYIYSSAGRWCCGYTPVWRQGCCGPAVPYGVDVGAVVGKVGGKGMAQDVRAALFDGGYQAKYRFTLL
jgi:hypothetical protein